jgi:hypothetical protein
MLITTWSQLLTRVITHSKSPKRGANQLNLVQMPCWHFRWPWAHYNNKKHTHWYEDISNSAQIKEKRNGILMHGNHFPTQWKGLTTACIPPRQHSHTKDLKSELLGKNMPLHHEHSFPILWQLNIPSTKPYHHHWIVLATRLKIN